MWGGTVGPPGRFPAGRSITDMENTALRSAIAAGCLAAAAVLVVHYPLPHVPLGLAAALYGLGLWYRPGLWLLVVPAVLPAVDLTPWTGWLYASESDVFLLITLGILALRSAPEREDLRWGGLPGVVLALTVLAYAIGVFRGLTSPYLLPHGSGNPYLLPANALRLAKGPAWALALLPFLRARQRRHGDVLVLFGAGVLTGLALVVAATVAERAVFPGVLDLTTDYRVVATFSSMEFGGDDIGTYLAMTLPFLIVCLLRPRPLAIGTLVLLAAGGMYALLVTFARAAYGATVLGVAAAGILPIALAPRRRGSRVLPALASIALAVVLTGITLGFAVDSSLMSARLRRMVPDFDTRWANWTGGLGLIDRTPTAWLLGMGLGTYPRVVRLRAPLDQRPSNFIVRHDGPVPYLELRMGSNFYFGQKVPIQSNRTYRLSLAFRAPSPAGGLSVLLCEKLLLYSDACRGATFRSNGTNRWRTAHALLSTAGMDQRVVAGLLRRPIELSLFGTRPGDVVDVTNIRLLDRRGRNLVHNGNFGAGTARWYFTDDKHLVWQIENQYLTSLFEGGMFGVFAFVLLGGTAIAGAMRAARRGEAVASAVAGSLLAFMAAGVFDDELAAPRMATLFYLVAFIGLGLWSDPRMSDTSRT